MAFNTIKLKNDKLFSLFMLLISLAFYLFFAFYDGTVICVDSPSYISMNISREPFYPMFLAFFRWIFSNLGEDFYLIPAIYIQSILAAISCWSLASFLTQRFHVGRLFSMIILFIPMAVSLLCRFAAQRGSMYSNSILTEGITISLYLLFFRFLLEYVTSYTRKSFVICCILSFVLISTRKQMAISLVMLMISICIVSFSKKGYGQGLINAILYALCVLLSTTFLDFGYNYVLRGEMIRHSSDTRFITTMAFYTAEKSDADYIENEDIRKLFEDIYDICEENRFLKHSAGTGWLNRVSHFGDNYDHIQIDTMWPLVNDFAKEHWSGSIPDLNKYADRIMDIIDLSVIPHNIPKIIATFMDNFLSGLVTTVAQRNSILIWYSIFIYIFYLALLFYHIRKGESRFIILFSSLTLLSILLNVGLVSLVIFCQTRYTIYNMALFYISLILMLESILKHIKKGRSL